MRSSLLRVKRKGGDSHYLPKMYRDLSSSSAVAEGDAADVRGGGGASRHHQSSPSSSFRGRGSGGGGGGKGWGSLKNATPEEREAYITGSWSRQNQGREHDLQTRERQGSAKPDRGAGRPRSKDHHDDGRALVKYNVDDSAIEEGAAALTRQALQHGDRDAPYYSKALQTAAVEGTLLDVMISDAKADEAEAAIPTMSLAKQFFKDMAAKSAGELDDGSGGEAGGGVDSMDGPKMPMTQAEREEEKRAANRSFLGQYCAMQGVLPFSEDATEEEMEETIKTFVDLTSKSCVDTLYSTPWDMPLTRVVTRQQLETYFQLASAKGGARHEVTSNNELIGKKDVCNLPLQPIPWRDDLFALKVPRNNFELSPREQLLLEDYAEGRIQLPKGTNVDALRPFLGAAAYAGLLSGSEVKTDELLLSSFSESNGTSSFLLGKTINGDGSATAALEAMLFKGNAAAAGTSKKAPEEMSSAATAGTSSAIPPLPHQQAGIIAGDKRLTLDDVLAEAESDDLQLPFLLRSSPPPRLTQQKEMQLRGQLFSREEQKKSEEPIDKATSSVVGPKEEVKEADATQLMLMGLDGFMEGECEGEAGTTMKAVVTSTDENKSFICDVTNADTFDVPLPPSLPSSSPLCSVAAGQVYAKGEHESGMMNTKKRLKAFENACEDDSLEDGEEVPYAFVKSLMSAKQSKLDTERGKEEEEGKTMTSMNNKSTAVAVPTKDEHLEGDVSDNDETTAYERLLSGKCNDGAEVLHEEKAAQITSSSAEDCKTHQYGTDDDDDLLLMGARGATTTLTTTIPTSFIPQGYPSSTAFEISGHHAAAEIAPSSATEMVKTRENGNSNVTITLQRGGDDDANTARMLALINKLEQAQTEQIDEAPLSTIQWLQKSTAAGVINPTSRLASIVSAIAVEKILSQTDKMGQSLDGDLRHPPIAVDLWPHPQWGMDSGHEGIYWEAAKLVEYIQKTSMIGAEGEGQEEKGEEQREVYSQRQQQCEGEAATAAKAVFIALHDAQFIERVCPRSVAFPREMFVTKWATPSTDHASSSQPPPTVRSKGSGRNNSRGVGGERERDEAVLLGGESKVSPPSARLSDEEWGSLIGDMPHTIERKEYDTTNDNDNDNDRTIVRKEKADRRGPRGGERGEKTAASSSDSSATRGLIPTERDMNTIPPFPSDRCLRSPSIAHMATTFKAKTVPKGLYERASVVLCVPPTTRDATRLSIDDVVSSTITTSSLASSSSLGAEDGGGGVDNEDDASAIDVMRAMPGSPDAGLPCNDFIRILTEGQERHCSKQKVLLTRGLQMLKEGGILIYATSTLDPHQNESVLATVLHKMGGVHGLSAVEAEESGSEVTVEETAKSAKEKDPNNKSLVNGGEKEKSQAIPLLPVFRCLPAFDFVSRMVDSELSSSSQTTAKSHGVDGEADEKEGEDPLLPLTALQAGLFEWAAVEPASPNAKGLLASDALPLAVRKHVADNCVRVDPLSDRFEGMFVAIIERRSASQEGEGARRFSVREEETNGAKKGLLPAAVADTTLSVSPAITTTSNTTVNEKDANLSTSSPPTSPSSPLSLVVVSSSTKDLCVARAERYKYVATSPTTEKVLRDALRESNMIPKSNNNTNTNTNNVDLSSRLKSSSAKAIGTSSSSQQPQPPRVSNAAATTLHQSVTNRPTSPHSLLLRPLFPPLSLLAYGSPVAVPASSSAAAVGALIYGNGLREAMARRKSSGVSSITLEEDEDFVDLPTAKTHRSLSSSPPLARFILPKDSLPFIPTSLSGTEELYELVAKQKDGGRSLKPSPPSPSSSFSSRKQRESNVNSSSSSSTVGGLLPPFTAYDLSSVQLMTLLSLPSNQRCGCVTGDVLRRLLLIGEEVGDEAGARAAFEITDEEVRSMRRQWATLLKTMTLSLISSIQRDRSSTSSSFSSSSSGVVSSLLLGPAKKEHSISCANMIFSVTLGMSGTSAEVQKSRKSEGEETIDDGTTVHPLVEDEVSKVRVVCHLATFASLRTLEDFVEHLQVYCLSPSSLHSDISPSSFFETESTNSTSRRHRRSLTPPHLLKVPLMISFGHNVPTIPDIRDGVVQPAAGGRQQRPTKSSYSNNNNRDASSSSSAAANVDDENGNTVMRVPAWIERRRRMIKSMAPLALYHERVEPTVSLFALKDSLAFCHRALGARPELGGLALPMTPAQLLSPYGLYVGGRDILTRQSQEEDEADEDRDGREEDDEDVLVGEEGMGLEGGGFSSLTVNAEIDSSSIGERSINAGNAAIEGRRRAAARMSQYGMMDLGRLDGGGDVSDHDDPVEEEEEEESLGLDDEILDYHRSFTKKHEGRDHKEEAGLKKVSNRSSHHPHAVFGVPPAEVEAYSHHKAIDDDEDADLTGAYHDRGHAGTNIVASSRFNRRRGNDDDNYENEVVRRYTNNSDSRSEEGMRRKRQRMTKLEKELGGFGVRVANSPEERGFEPTHNEEDNGGGDWLSAAAHRRRNQR